jgi:hypothetical protein
LLGCFTISILSFILPPLCHFKIVTYPASNRETSSNGSNSDASPDRSYYIDVIFIIFGVLICILGTTLTAIGVKDKILSGVC